MRDCKEVLGAGYKVTGSYRLNPTPEQEAVNDEMGPFRAYCDQKTAGGGWTVVMRRLDGFVNFHRRWNSYANGFGSISGEFWFGLIKMRQLCYDVPLNIRFDFDAENGAKPYAEYSHCQIDTWGTSYTLRVGKFIGKTKLMFLNSCLRIPYFVTEGLNDKYDSFIQE